MGIDGLSGVTGAANYQSQPAAAKTIVQESSSVNKAAYESAAQTNQSATGDAAVVIGQTTGSGQSASNYDAQQESSQKEITMDDMKNINKVINNNTIAEFGYNEPTKRITIKIKDKDTDEVIKEIPSDKALEMLAKAWELAGLLVDEKR